MEYSSVSIEIPRKSWIDRIQAVFEILLMSGIVSFFLASLPLLGFRGGKVELLLKNATFISLYLLLESAITFLILGILLKAHRETIRSLGVRWENWRRNAAIGLALVPFLFLINGLIVFIFKNYFPEHFLKINPLTDTIHSPQQLALFIFSALVAGGIKEELQRAFVINRFRDFLGGAAVGLVVWSMAFGAGHYVQHAQGVVVATLYGFFFGTIYILSGSLVAPIVAHSAYDTLALLAYWFLSGRHQ